MSSHLRTYASVRPEREELPDPVNQLRQAGALRRAVEEAISPWDLTWAELDTLITLREEGPLGVRETQRAMTRRTNAGPMPRVDNLIDKGYLGKDPHPTNGAKKLLSLTSEGSAALNQALLALESEEVPTSAKAAET